MRKTILYRPLLLPLHSLHRQFLYSLKCHHLLLQYPKDVVVTTASLVAH